MKRTELAKHKAKKIESRIDRAPASGRASSPASDRKTRRPNDLVARLLKKGMQEKK